MVVLKYFRIWGRREFVETGNPWKDKDFFFKKIEEWALGET